MRAGAFMEISVQRMVCTGCGSEANASCNCGKPYLPAKVRAAEAIRDNPFKSDRAIASEIGVDHKTVGAARREATGDYSPVEREGLDGKIRRLPVKENATPDNESLQGLLTLIDLALRVADLNFAQIKPTPELRSAIRRVIETWTKMEGALQ